MAVCVFCGGPNREERVEIGKTHCTRHECVAEWRRRRNDDHGLVLIDLHKQGLMWMTKDSDAVTNDGRHD
jgi:hypothetical protein